MLTGADPLLPQPGPPDHRAGDALGDEHRVAAGQVLAAWTRTGHDQVLYKGEKQELSKSETSHQKVRPTLSCRQMSQSSLTRRDFHESLVARTTGNTAGRYFPVMVVTKSLPKKYFPTSR